MSSICFACRASADYEGDDSEPAGTARAADEVLSDADQQFLQKVKTVVERQIEEGHVSVDAMAQEFCMSITTFRRRFTAVAGDKPQAYIMRLRMEKARQLLTEHPELTVAEVGQRCGFDDKSNFTRAFKHTFGMTPTDFLRQ